MQHYDCIMFVCLLCKMWMTSSCDLLCIVIYLRSLYCIKLPCCNRQHLLSVSWTMSNFSMSQCDKSVPQGCNTITTRLARELIPLKPAPSVPQGCNTVTRRLARALIPLKPTPSIPQGCNSVTTQWARALIPLKPAPAQKSSAKQKVDFFSSVFDFEKVYNNDDITFFFCVLTFGQALVI